MSKQDLDSAQINAALDEVRGEAISQGVAADAAGESGAPAHLCHRSCQRSTEKRSRRAHRSELVRRQAANRAVTVRLRELLPAMAVAASRERKPAVREELKTCHRLLRDGYILASAGRGYVEVTVSFDGGGMGSTTVSRAELKARGVEAIAAEYRAKY